MKQKYTTMLIAFLCIILFPLIPIEGLSQDAMRVLGIFLGVLLLWIRVGIDWPSLLCIGALAFVPSLGGIKNIFLSSFGNHIFVFLMLTFVCTYAFSKTSYIKRIALSFITSRFAKKGPYHLAIAFFLSVLLVGSFISPTVLFFIMYPILEEMFLLMNIKKGDSYASMMLIGLVTCTSLSSALTPIAHVFPVLALGALEKVTGLVVSQLDYMLFAIPSGLLLFVLMMGIFRFIMKPNTTQFQPLHKKDFQDVKTSNIHDKYTIAILILVVILWILPDMLKGIAPSIYTALNSLTIAFPPLLGIILLSIIHVDKKPLLNFNEAMSKGVSWPSMIMTASTLALGAAMTNENVGLTTFMEGVISSSTSNLPVLLIVFVFILWAAVQSNLSSHMVTATLVSTVAIQVSLNNPAIHMSALVALIGWIACIGSSTPSSMPYVAVSGSSGWTSAKSLLLYGSFIMIATILVAFFFSYPLLTTIL